MGWPTGSIADIYRADAAAYDGKGLGPYCEFFAGSNGDWVDTLQRMQQVGWGQHPNERVPVLCAKVHTNSSLDEVITYFGERKITWCAVFMHEIQGFIMNGDISIRQYRKTHEQMARVASVTCGTASTCGSWVSTRATGSLGTRIG